MVKNFLLPISMFPEELRKGEKLRLSQSVREIETMAANAREPLLHPWPQEAVMLLRDTVALSGGMVLAEIYQPISRYNLEAILDAVRNKLLDFLLKLQELDPGVLNSDEAIGTIPRERVARAFNVTFHGDNNVVTTGDSAIVSVAHNVKAHDEKTLLGVLSDLGIPDADLRELQDAIHHDGKQSDRKLGKRVSQWFGKVVAKAADGTYAIALEVALAVIKQAIFEYYGWK